jgi:hypothetical protein
MADKSTKQLVGMIEDVLLRLDHHVIPTNFIIVDIPKDEKLSIILGRPFLNTAATTTDGMEGKVTFRIYDEKIIRYFPCKPREVKK